VVFYLIEVRRNERTRKEIDDGWQGEEIQCAVADWNSEAWELGHGTPVVLVEGIAGDVALSHLRLKENHDPEPGHR
jgi:hypothetical protein